MGEEHHISYADKDLRLIGKIFRQVDFNYQGNID